MGSMTYINVAINAGIEKGKDRLTAGSVAFLPGQKCLCFVTQDCAPGRQLTPLGSMNGDYTILNKLKPGDMLEVYEDTG